MYSKLHSTMTMLHSMAQNKDSHESIQKFILESVPPLLAEAIDGDIRKCTACELHKNGCSTFSGDFRSPIMFVGEASGESEAACGIPFVGQAGQMFDRILKAAETKLNPFWNRSSVYITNVVHCRPVESGKNRTPLIGEIAACRTHLNRELQLVKPKVIICVGSVAASALLHPDFAITKEHGTFFQLPNDVLGVAIYHPSYILHQGEATPEGKAIMNEVWSDMVKINERIAPLISAS